MLLGESLKLLLSVIGIVLLIEGLPYMLFPGRMKEMMRMLLEVDSRLLRLFGLLMTILGLAAIVAVRLKS